MGTEYRLDDLARRAGVQSTTVRLYQAKGLLSPPRLEGRTGWYDDAHLRPVAPHRPPAGRRALARRHRLPARPVGAGPQPRRGDRGRGRARRAARRRPRGRARPGRAARPVPRRRDDARGDAACRRARAGRARRGRAGPHSRPPLRRDRVDPGRARHPGRRDPRRVGGPRRRTPTRSPGGSSPCSSSDSLPPTGAPDSTPTRPGSSPPPSPRLQATARQVLVAALDASVARLGRERLSDLVDR